MSERLQRQGRSARPAEGVPGAASRLHALLREIDGAPFGAYRRLVGAWSVGEFTIRIDRVPPDPFAGPSRIRLVVDRATAGLPPDLVAHRAGRIAVEDCLARRTLASLAQWHGPRTAGRASGRPVRIQEVGAAVVERSACRITAGSIELRLFVDLPAERRRVMGREAHELLSAVLPRLATAGLLFSQRAVEQARRAVQVVEDHAALQEALRARGLVAFVAEGSRLARSGGGIDDEDAPRADGREVPFAVPETLAVTVELPHAGKVRGLGVPAGVTLIVGGAFHGKSTLLEAVARGVHPHREGDGREQVAALPGTVAVRAEDGRPVRAVDISAFLQDPPSGAVARQFTTDRASGSTSQAASIVEALQAGAQLLLLDEDRSATNFMVRDGRMQRLVPKSEEPITPLIDRVRELHATQGVSTIVVTGGSGDYLDVADTVIRMRDYEAVDATERARQVARETRSMRLTEDVAPWAPARPRVPRFDRLGHAAATMRFATRGPRALRAGEETIDLAALEQVVETGQVRALARLLRRLVRGGGEPRPLPALLDEIEAWLDRVGPDGLEPPAAYDLSRPRRFELAAALDRWRGLGWDDGAP